VIDAAKAGKAEPHQQGAKTEPTALAAELVALALVMASVVALSGWEPGKAPQSSTYSHFKGKPLDGAAVHHYHSGGPADGGSAAEKTCLVVGPCRPKAVPAPVPSSSEYA